MECTLKSGVKLVVSPAPFQDANTLRKALFKTISDLGSLDFSSEAVLQKALSDEDVERAFFRCGEKAIYDGIKVSPSLFDDPRSGEKARSDYFELFAKILEVNINPFFQVASSASSAPRAIADAQR